MNRSAHERRRMVLQALEQVAKRARSHGGNLHASDSLKASSSPPIHCGDGRLVLVVFLLPVVVQSLCARLFVASHSFALGYFSPSRQLIGSNPFGRSFSAPCPDRHPPLAQHQGHRPHVLPLVEVQLPSTRSCRTCQIYFRCMRRGPCQIRR